ncbi:MAG: hypothetical protein K1X75_15995 [Leptospirales bacterium]|nr:hypothetical protein [Leptospirales bacterium]
MLQAGLLLLLLPGMLSAQPVYRYSRQASTDGVVDLSSAPDLAEYEFSARPLRLVFVLKPYGARASQWNALRLVAWETSSIFDQIRNGARYDDIPFFAAGSGLAAERGGYTQLYLDQNAMHYIFCQTSPGGDCRATLVRQQGDRLLLRWEIASVVLQGQGEGSPIAALGGRTLYLAAAIDANNNGILDPGECKRLRILLR